MKRNNILSYLLFGMTAVFPVVYLVVRLFLPDYTVLFNGLIICADVRNVIMIGICIAMLLFKDKTVGRAAKVLLIASLMLLPVSRLLMIWNTDVSVGTWDSVIYLFMIVILIVTVWKYIRVIPLMAAGIVVFSVVMGMSLFYSSVSLLFSYGKIGDIADIPSPDGIHHVRVVEYADDDVKDYHIKNVYVYNSEESFSIGPIEFLKDRKRIGEEHEIDVDSQITFQDNGTFTVKDRTYTYGGKYVPEPSEPPL